MEKPEIVRRAKNLIAEAKVALLATCGLDGHPNARWMATHTLAGGIERFYTLTAPNSNKTREIAADPRVTWLLNRVNHTEVLKLHGVASVEDDPLLKAQIWDLVGKKTKQYFTIHDGQSEFVVLVTEVKAIEYFAPGEGIHKPIVVRLDET